MANVSVRPIDKSELPAVKNWILNSHYIRRWPKAVQAVLGIYADNKLVGTLLYGIGTRAQSAREIFHNEDGSPIMSNNQMWELQRAFTTDEAKKEIPNLGSQAVSRGNDWIRQNAKTKDGKPIKAIISYADSAAGHTGKVYQSTNATYLGEQPPLPYFVVTNPENGKFSRLSKLKPAARQKLQDKGYKIERFKPKSGKHKFIYALGKDQSERDQLLAKLAKPIYEYPDGKSPPKQIPNVAKEKSQKKPAVHQSQSFTSRRELIQHLLKSKVKNPKTGHSIFVKSALQYDKEHPAYKQAHGMIKALLAKNKFNESFSVIR